MSASATANAWWTLFYNCVMVVSTADARPVCFLFDIIVIRVRDLVLLDGGVLARCVLYPLLCTGAVVLITCLCIFFLILCLATVDCSTLVTI